MPNRTMYIPQHLCDHLDREPNKSGIVSMLLAGHYAATKPGPAMPTIERSDAEKQQYQEKLAKLRDAMQQPYKKEVISHNSSPSPAFEPNVFPPEETA